MPPITFQEIKRDHHRDPIEILAIVWTYKPTPKMLNTRTTVDCSKGLVYKPTFIDILKLILLWYHRGSNEYGIANNRSITCKGGKEMDPAHKVSTR